MPLTIKLKNESSIPLEVDSITMEQVQTQTADEVARTKIFRGNEQPELGEYFDVSGSATDDQTIVWEGNLAKVKLIGSKLTHGKVQVEGSVGMHLGAEMTGGEIVLNGNADDWVGAEMKGGRIRVNGNVRHMLGAAYRGSIKGMTGGEILVDGNAGNELGNSMRRGLIAVSGNIGDVAGAAMIAGSILIFGETGIRHGAGMKRGTIALFNAESAPRMLPTFKKAITFRPLFMRFYLQHLKELGFPVADEHFDVSFHRYLGDFLELGKGEILVAA